MVSWGTFVQREPDMAAAGHRLFTQFGPALAFLATVTRDGMPRLHPITLAITDEELYAFVVGPKGRDLAARRPYAMHAFLPDEIEEEFLLMGRAQPAPSPNDRRAALAAYHVPNPPEDHYLYRFSIERALHATYRFRGDWPPTYRVWRADVSGDDAN